MNEDVKGKLQILTMLLVIILIIFAFAYVLTHTAVQFPEAEAKKADTLNVVLQPEDVKLAPLQVQDFYAYALNGTPPYTFYWEHQIWYNETDHTNRTYFSNTNSTPFAFKTVSKYAILFCTVTDAEGSTGYDTVIVYDPTAFTISVGMYPGADGYTIWIEDGTCYAKNSYGSVDYSGVDVSTVANNAIQGLISGTVTFLNGTYQITSSIIMKDNVWINGESWNTTLQATGTMDAIIGPISGSKVDNVQISNLAFDVNNQQVGYAILTGGLTVGDGATNFYVKNCYFTGGRAWDSGYSTNYVKVQHTDGGGYYNNFVDDGYTYNGTTGCVGLQVGRNSHHFTVAYNSVFDLFDNSIEVGVNHATDNVSDVIVSHNTIWANEQRTEYGRGVNVFGQVYNVLVDGNIIYNKGSRGIDVGTDGTSYTPSNVTVTNNIIHNTYRAMIRFESLNGGVASNNIVYPEPTDGTSRIVFNTVTNFVLGDNAGFISHNCGATIAIANGSVIDHGLSTTPTIITITATDAGLSEIHIPTITSSNFTVYYTGGGTHVFYWDARYKP